MGRHFTFTAMGQKQFQLFEIILSGKLLMIIFLSSPFKMRHMFIYSVSINLQRCHHWILIFKFVKSLYREAVGWPRTSYKALCQVEEGEAGRERGGKTISKSGQA